MLRLLLIIFLCGWLPAVAAAQPGPLTTAKFFGAAAVPTTPAPARRARKMPWVERYELRTETRDFEPDRQEFTLRLTPSTPAKRRAQSALYNHLLDAPDVDAEEDRCEAIATKYYDWIRLYKLTVEDSLLTALRVIQTDRKTVLDRQAAAGDPAYAGLINWRKDETDRRVRYAAVTRARTDLRAAYKLGSAPLAFRDMVTVAGIRRRTQEATYAVNDPETAYDLEKISRELALERAEKRQYLDFVQLKYQGPSADPARERFSVGVGLQLPTDGDDLLKVRELELEQQALETERRRDLTVASNNWAARQQALLSTIDQLVTLTEIYAEEALEFEWIKTLMLREETVRPLPILDLLERRIRNELRLLALRAEVYEEYVELLQRSGEVCSAGRGELLR